MRTMSEQLPENIPPESEQPDVWTIRRILVALDASSNSRVALATAVHLAETLRSEIHGLFVEDINLLRLAELPFVREVLFAEPAFRQLESEEMQRKLRARAAILRRELEEMTSEHKITGRFRVIRGTVDRELLAAATEMEADLLAVGRLGNSIVRRGRMGSTARAIVARATSAVLLVKADVQDGPVVALYDGSATGRRALSLAARLTGPAGDLRVLVWGLDEGEAFERQQFTTRLMETLEVEAQFQHLSGDLPIRVLQWVNRQKASLLILGGGDCMLPEDIFSLLLDEAEQHILLIR